MRDLIDRQAAIDTAVEAADEWDGGYSRSREEIITMKLRMLPSAQTEPNCVIIIAETGCSDCQIKAKITKALELFGNPEQSAQSKRTNKRTETHECDLISRQAAIDAIEKLHIPEDMCVFEILSHIELSIGTLPSAEPDTPMRGSKVAETAGNGTDRTTDDCISRQDAIDALDEQIKYCDKALASFDISLKDEYAIKVERASLNAFRETLKYLPSAEPERPIGHWIKAPDSPYIYECSECGRGVVTEHGTDGVYEAFPYCHCGAKMEVELEVDHE